MTDAEKKELPTSLFILSGTNCFRRAAVWFVRWVVFEWVIILTIIGKLERDIEKIHRIIIFEGYALSFAYEANTMSRFL